MKGLSHSFSIVLETENLGMADIDDLMESLDSLKQQSLSIEKANEVIVVIGNHVTKATQAKLIRLYPWLKLHVATKELEYTKAKMEGARVATGSIIVFADSDVRYQKSWLKNLLHVFAVHPDAAVASGQTRLKINSAYTLSLSLSWMINIWPTTHQTTQTKVFALNNFAIKRQILLDYPFPALTLYRGKITLWRSRLTKLGFMFYKTPAAVGHHAPPGNLTDWWYRMLIYGADFVASADFNQSPDGSITEKRFMLKRLLHLFMWGGMKIKQFVLHSFRILRQEPQNVRFFIFGLPLTFINIGVTILGGVIAVINRDFCYKKITALESGHAR